LRRSHTPALILLALALALGGEPAIASPLWGELKPGPHAVGYRTVFTYDLSRPPLDGAGEAAPGRQMQINVWYPARARRGQQTMPFGRYVGLLFREVDFAARRGVTPKQLAEKFMENPAELGGDASALAPHVESLLRAETAAVEDAPPAAGRFPLVVFPAYRTPATQSIMCEYLASHGFVVASTGLKGTHESEFDAGLSGLETIVADVLFVVGELNASPSVDRKRLALVGVGVAASGGLALHMRHPGVGALVSLDGGIPTPFEDRLLKRTPYYDLAAVRAPVLAIHAPHPNVNPAFFDQYRYAARHLVHFPRMSEFHFLNYGMMERFAPNLIGRPPGDTKAGFEWAARYVLHFLEGYLNGDAASLEFLRRAPEANGVPPGLAAATTKPAAKPAPTLPELKALFRGGGMAGVVALYRELKRDDAQPFSQEKFVDFYNWLSYRRDPEWKARRELALLRVDSYPDSSRAHFTLAQVAVQLKDGELARKHFNEALRLLPSDADPALEPATRRRIEEVARQNLGSP
jgi:hypothetical protein